MLCFVVEGPLEKIDIIKIKSAFQVSPRFGLKLHKRDLLLLVQIQVVFYGIGKIT